MSVAEEDTELRDLLVQTLENSGVLNKIKAELRAAVFLALEEQETVENQTPLVNESLKKFLNTKDGRLVAGLVTEFLQFFNLDFTLAVFQPETNTFTGLDGRDNLARELGIHEGDGLKGAPLLLEVIRRGQQKEKDHYLSDVAQDITDVVQSPRKLPEGRQNALNTGSKIPRYKGIGKVKENGEKAGEKITNNSLGDTSIASGDIKSITNLSSGEPKQDLMPNTATSLPELKKDGKLYLHEDEDSFFDDPLPEQMKIYGWPSQGDKSVSGLRSSDSKKNGIQKTHTDLNSKPTGGLTSLSDAPPLTANLGSLAGAPPLKEADIKGTGDEEEYYDDDFISGSQRSDKTKSEMSIGEEIEEDISIEGEDISTGDKLDDFTLDHTISHCSDVADYIEEVA
ncbi:FGFR1 oncogene partner isoform X2 [Heterodontus francisci]|uniref:FGFR1 oncogene partner isoform X2 n=1 Tax=Heterodontus francisci TaxID=7792 RepID=UPI00355AE685